jgi:hypothetical protein
VEAFDLAGHFRVSLRGRDDVTGGLRSAFQLKGRHLQPIQVGLDGISGQSPDEIVAQLATGLRGEALGPAGLIHAHRELGARFRGQCRPSAVVDGGAASSRDPKGGQQQMTNGGPPLTASSGGFMGDRQPG